MDWKSDVQHANRYLYDILMDTEDKDKARKNTLWAIKHLKRALSELNNEDKIGKLFNTVNP
jgi:hypothetical protein